LAIRERGALGFLQKEKERGSSTDKPHRGGGEEGQVIKKVTKKTVLTCGGNVSEFKVRVYYGLLDAKRRALFVGCRGGYKRTSRGFLRAVGLEKLWQRTPN